MDLSLSLALPRDELSVPVARRVVEASMRAIGVTDDVLGDLTLSLTEACTNVLKHSGPGEEYEVCVRIDDHSATIEVVDVGQGFDPSKVGEMQPDDAEHGRGVQLIRALVDEARFASGADGSVVHLVKHLEYKPGSLADLASD